MKVRVRHEGAYTNAHSYSRIIEYDLDDYAAVTDQDFNEWWDEFLFQDTGDNVTQPGIGSWYRATIVEAEDPTLVDQQWEWCD